MKKTATYITRTIFMLATSMITVPAAAQGYSQDAAAYDQNGQVNVLRLPTGNPNGADIVDNSVGSPDTSSTGVRYISGGISEEGRDGFLAAHQGEGFNTQLMFTGPAGNYLADVDVTIADRKGAQVLSTRTDGPLLLAALPAGSYSVHASYNGVARSAKLNVGKNGTAKAAFRFPNGD